MKKLFIAAAAASCACAASAAVYDTAGVGGSSGNDGNQNYGEMLGLDFTVNVSGLQVTALGAFNDHLDGISSNITVGLYDLTANAAVISPISFNGLNGSTTYLFQTLSNPVALIAGHQYSVQAFGYGGAPTDGNYNTNIIPANNPSNAQVTSPITFNSYGGWLTNNNSRYGGTSMGTGTTFAHASTFGAGTLEVSAVPEPETYAMLLAGLGVMGFLGRRRKA